MVSTGLGGDVDALRDITEGGFVEVCNKIFLYALTRGSCWQSGWKEMGLGLEIGLKKVEVRFEIMLMKSWGWN